MSTPLLASPPSPTFQHWWSLFVDLHGHCYPRFSWTLPSLPRESMKHREGTGQPQRVRTNKKNSVFFKAHQFPGVFLPLLQPFTPQSTGPSRHQGVVLILPIVAAVVLLVNDLPSLAILLLPMSCIPSPCTHYDPRSPTVLQFG